MNLQKISDELKDFLGTDLFNVSLKIIRVAVIILIAAITVKIGSIIIKKAMQKQKSFRYGIGSKKIDTMSSLLVSIFRYSIYIISIVMILGDIFKFTSILAAAGIGGVAVGFGAQSLIRDVISGVFIVMEDQYVVGDLVTIDNMTGNVEDMELRVTKLRNANGDLHIIPNGEIKKLTNHTRGDKAAIVDIPLSYSADMRNAVLVATQVCEKVAGEFDTIVENPRVIGITDLGKDGLNLRIMAKTLPNEHWEVERRIRLLINEYFNREKIDFIDKRRA